MRSSLSAAPLSHCERSTGSASSPATTCAARWGSASRRSAMAGARRCCAWRRVTGSSTTRRARPRIEPPAAGLHRHRARCGRRGVAGERGRVPALAAPGMSPAVAAASPSVTHPGLLSGWASGPCAQVEGRSAELTSHRHAHGLRSHARAPARSRPFVPSHPRGRRADDRAHGGLPTLTRGHPGRRDGPRRAARPLVRAHRRGRRARGGVLRHAGRDPVGRALDRRNPARDHPFDAPWHAVRSCVAVTAIGSRSARGRTSRPGPRGTCSRPGRCWSAGAASVGVGDDREGFSAGSGQFDSDITDGRHPRAALGIDDNLLIAMVSDGRGRGRGGAHPSRARPPDGRPRRPRRDQPRRRRLGDADRRRQPAQPPAPGLGLDVHGGRPLATALVLGHRRPAQIPAAAA